MIVRRLAPALLAFTLLIAACRKAEITTYRVPREADPAMPPASNAGPPADAQSGMAATPVATAAGAALAWTAPAHWKPKAASSMRKGSFAVPGEGAEADLSITAFPADVGGELANVNRWRNQIGLPPVAAADLASAVTRLEHHGLKFGVVDLAGAGAPPQRILGAWTPFDGSTWFFKLTGPDALVAKEKAAFLAFLATVKPAPAPTP